MKRRDFLKAAGVTLAMGPLCIGNPPHELDDWRNLNFLRRTIKDPKPNEPHFIANLINRPMHFQSRAYAYNRWLPFRKVKGGILLHEPEERHPIMIPQYEVGHYGGKDPLKNCWTRIGRHIEEMKPYGQVCLFIHEKTTEPTAAYGSFTLSMVCPIKPSLVDRTLIFREGQTDG